jgi:hypothetical protein
MSPTLIHTLVAVVAHSIRQGSRRSITILMINPCESGLSALVNRFYFH